MTSWHALDRHQVLKELDTKPDGLSSEEVARRQTQYGPNALERRGGRSPWVVLIGQFTEVMVLVLLVAVAISFAVGETTDAIMILIIVILNALLGFTQEYRAERAMEALQELSVPMVRVRRDGQVQEIETTELVPGDIVLLEAGARIPADARLLEVANLRVDEAALTGESVPVDKTTKVPESKEDDQVPLGDQQNMVFMGTVAVYGRGVAVVVETGMRTQLGNIADLLQTVSEEKTPLQRRMAELGKWLALGALVVVVIVFAVGVWRGESVTLMFLTAVSLAVAAVPEGLPAVVTIALALGARRMVQRHALIRRLPAVETLGSVTTICSDKTGTLTENRMTVTMLDVAGESLNLEETLHMSGAILAPADASASPPPPETAGPNISLLLAIGALCNDAVLQQDEDGLGGYQALGDPTEGALVVAAARMGLWKDNLEEIMPRVAEAPFTSERKRMSTVQRLPNGDGPPQIEDEEEPVASLLRTLPESPYLVMCKGSVDSLLAVADRVWENGVIHEMDDEWRQRIQDANDELAQEGMRVLGAAIRPLDALPNDSHEETLERELIFVGISGMIDPPRSEVRQAVTECRTAGIRPVMITGDHPLTALHIARDLGIVQNGHQAGDGRIITGAQLAEMSVEELEAVVEEVSIYARVSPEHKVKIVEALKSKGHYVAMTGDGVNDAPALKRADIGVAMGITGTDVSKEASDMVLLDDNFATIVHAIEEGRTIYDNIRKFVSYIISCNVGEIFLMFISPLLGLPIPLTALQLLWINLITDGLPALALGVERSEPNTMRRPPHPPDESVLARGLGPYILWVGVLLGSICVGTQFVAVRSYNAPREVWQTMVFSILGLSQMGRAMAARSDHESLLALGPFSNRALVGAVLSSVTLQLIVIYAPFAQELFGTTALTLEQFLITLALSSIVFFAVEINKWIKRQQSAGHAHSVSLPLS